MGKYSIFGCAPFTGQPFYLGTAGMRQGMATRAADQRSLSDCGTCFLLCSARGISRLGVKLPSTAQQLPSFLGCPSQNMENPLVPSRPLCSAPGDSSAATQDKSRGAALVFLSLGGSERLEPAPDPGRHFPSTPKTDALRASTCSANAATASTEASPPPGTAWDVPAELREGAEPWHPAGPTCAKNTQCGSSELQQL